MRIPFLVVLVSATACGSDGFEINSQEDGTEPAYVNSKQCTMVFPGALTSSTQMYQIWPVGTGGIVDTPYDTPGTPNFYAVFGTGEPPFETHHVDGQDMFDHYHVMEDPDGGDVENDVWDLLTVSPGPNYDATTYTSATSVDELEMQINAGVLGPVQTLPDIGFPPLVLFAPVVCR